MTSRSTDWKGIAEARLRLQVAQGGDWLSLRLDVFFDLALLAPMSLRPRAAPALR